MKPIARAAAKRRRAEAAPQVPDAAERVADRLLTAIPLPVPTEPGAGPGAGVVAGYWPIGSELDVRPALRRFGVAGWRCALPVVNQPGHVLRFRAWNLEVALAEGAHGIPEPGPDAAELEPSVLLVPLLAFDRDGYRLGYGGGYYDRTLAELRRRPGVLAIGIAYAAQEMAELPREAHDQPLDWIVTEEFALKTRPQR